MWKQKNLTKNIAIKLNQYPKEDHQVLIDITKRVIDRAFSAINIADSSTHKNLFASLAEDIDMTLAKCYALVKCKAPRQRNLIIIGVERFDLEKPLLGSKYHIINLTYLL